MKHATFDKILKLPETIYHVYAYTRCRSGFALMQTECEPISTEQDAIFAVVDAIDNWGDVADIIIHRSDMETPRRDVTEDLMAKVVEHYTKDADEHTCLPSVIEGWGGGDAMERILASAADDARHIRQESHGWEQV